MKIEKDEFGLLAIIDKIIVIEVEGKEDNLVYPQTIAGKVATVINVDADFQYVYFYSYFEIEGDGTTGEHPTNGININCEGEVKISIKLSADKEKWFATAKGKVIAIR
jgi:hypothetical protein